MSKESHLPQVASSVVDRVCDISRHFPLALDVGCGRGHIARLMSDDLIGSLYQLDMAESSGESTMRGLTVINYFFNFVNDATIH